MELPSVAPQPKRLVLEHTSGPLKGIHQIFTLAEAYPPHLNGPFSVDGEKIVEFASLIKVNPGWVHYRETFSQSHLAGRLDDFMPEGPKPSFSKDQV